MIDIRQILKFLPHRFPFLLVDRILDIKEGEYVRALKNVTYNEPYFTGHFPEDPVMPGVLILEAMAQASGIIPASTMSEEERENIRVYFTGIDNARFRKVVLPGDTLIIESRVLKKKRNIWKVEAKAFVEDKLVAEAILQAAVVEK